MRKILITGGAGFIPSSLADELSKDASNEIVLVDNFETGYKYNLTCLDKPNCKFIKADVNNYKDQLDIDSNLIFSQSKVTLNSSKIPELNKDAVITMYNI
jgi:nucleoside-diphosphate-sugar epimerase